MSQQARLDAFRRPPMRRVYTPPVATPQDAGERIDTDDTTCRNCGATVDRDFRRVFGDNDGIAHACPECANQGQIRDGAAADPEFDLSLTAAQQGLSAHGFPAAGGEF